MDLRENNGTMIKLTANNYTVWKPRMEDILYCRDLYDPIENDGVKPDDEDEKEWNKLNRKTVGMIRLFIDQSVFHHFTQETDAHSLWTKLEDMYERKHAQNKTYLIRQLVNLKYNEGSSVAEHLSTFQSILNQLTAVALKFDDEMHGLFLLGSLPDSFETLVVSLSNSAPDGILTMDMVKNSLFNEETRRMGQGAESSQSLAVESRGRHKGNDRDKGKGSSKFRDPRKCYYCNKPGHVIKDCYKRKQDEGDQKKTNQKKVDSDNEEDTSATVFPDGDVVVLSSEKHNCLHMASSDADWVIDSAASFHATPNKEFFSTYKMGDFGTVKFGNNNKASIVGVGDVCIQTNTGYMLTLKDVRHVPDLRLNLISGVELDRQGYVSCFGNERWKLTKRSMVVARGAISGNLYKTRVKVCSTGLTTAKDESSSNSWQVKTLSDEEKFWQGKPSFLLPKSSDEEEVEEGGEKKKKKKGLKEKIKEKISGEKKEVEKAEVKYDQDTSVPIEKCDEIPTQEPEEKKGFLDKIKEKLPGGKKAEEVVASPPPTPSAGPESVATPEAEGKEKKGFLDKIKEKIPGYHSKSDEEKEKEKEKDAAYH